jgi:hypothetical protein
LDTPGDHAGDLSFDKATYTHDASAGPPCSNCKGPLGEQYWQWQTRSVCAKCRGQLSELLERSQSKSAFWRAVWLGSATALGCGVAYAIFVAVANFQFALVTIGIAFLIAKVMRRCSAGVGGRKYQILAVVLTYVASAMGYAPGVMSGLRGDSDEAESASQPTAAGAKPDRPKSAARAREAREAHAPTNEHVGAGQLLLGLALIFGITLAAPILAATEAPMGLLIVGFGLWEAWKLSRGLPLTLDGPYRAGAAGPESPAT